MGFKVPSLTKFAKNHPFALSICTPFVLSAAMQLGPEISSEPAADYLRDNNYPASLTERFNTESIRVYGRLNPLSALHMMGRPYAIMAESMSGDWGDNAMEVARLPFRLFSTTLHAIVHYIPPYDSIDAYAVTLSDPCFIRPPSAKVDLATALADLGHSEAIRDVENLVLETDQAQLEDAFRTITMAHEMQHCEQGWTLYDTLLRESDADLMAMQVFWDSGYSPEVKQEAYKLYVAARLLGGRDDYESHDTGVNVMNGDSLALSSFKRVRAQRMLTELADLGVQYNYFPEDMDDDEKDFHMIMGLMASPILDSFEPEMREYAAAYVRAYLYLNKVTGGAMLGKPEYFTKISTSFATTEGPSKGPELNGYDVEF